MNQTATMAMRPLVQAHIVTVAAGGILFTNCALLLLVCHYTSMLLGDSLWAYGLLPPLSITALGLGSVFSHRIVKTQALLYFLASQCLFSVICCALLPLLYSCTGSDFALRATSLVGVFLTSSLCGLLLPLLDPIEKRKEAGFRFSIGMLPAIGLILAPALALVSLLLPLIGFFRCAGLLGLLNSLFSVGVFYTFPKVLKKQGHLWFSTIVLTVLLGLSVVIFSNQIRRVLELTLFNLY